MFIVSEREFLECTWILISVKFSKGTFKYNLFENQGVPL